MITLDFWDTAVEVLGEFFTFLAELGAFLFDHPLFALVLFFYILISARRRKKRSGSSKPAKQSKLSRSYESTNGTIDGFQPKPRSADEWVFHSGPFVPSSGRSYREVYSKYGYNLNLVPKGKSYCIYWRPSKNEYKMLIEI